MKIPLTEGSVTLNKLYIALMEKGIRPEAAAKIIADVLGCTEKTARNKLNKVTEFTVSEAVKINEVLFQNKYDIGILFSDTGNSTEHEADKAVGEW